MQVSQPSQTETDKSKKPRQQRPGHPGTFHTDLLLIQAEQNSEALSQVAAWEDMNRKRMKRFELSTLSLARRCSTTELHPRSAAVRCPSRPTDHAPPRCRRSNNTGQFTERHGSLHKPLPVIPSHRSSKWTTWSQPLRAGSYATRETDAHSKSRRRQSRQPGNRLAAPSE